MERGREVNPEFNLLANSLEAQSSFQDVTCLEWLTTGVLEHADEEITEGRSSTIDLEIERGILLGDRLPRSFLLKYQREKGFRTILILRYEGLSIHRKIVEPISNQD